MFRSLIICWAKNHKLKKRKGIAQGVGGAVDLVGSVVKLVSVTMISVDASLMSLRVEDVGLKIKFKAYFNSVSRSTPIDSPSFSMVSLVFSTN